MVTRMCGLIIICILTCNISCIRQNGINSHVGMEQILGEDNHKNEHYISVLFGEGFQDKVFFIALFKVKIKYKEDGSPNSDEALLFEYVDLKEVEIAFDTYRPTRFPEKSKIDFENRKLILLFDNGDIEIYSF